MAQQTDRKRQQPHFAGVGLVLGAAAGFALSMGDPVSAAMGAAVGLILGAALDTMKREEPGKDGGKQ